MGSACKYRHRDKSGCQILAGAGSWKSLSLYPFYNKGLGFSGLRSTSNSLVNVKTSSPILTMEDFIVRMPTFIA